jgi:hypothetical protein
MEHRCSVRSPRRLKVEVFKQERSLGRYITRDMDVEGVFIEMRTTDLVPNDVVKLNFIAPDDECSNYSLMAGVVRLSVEGAGMMLFDYQHKALDILGASELSTEKLGGRAQIAVQASKKSGQRILCTVSARVVH